MSSNSSSTNARQSANVDGDYVETRGPPVPDVAYKIINPLMKLLLRSPLHTLVSGSLLLLTFTGTKTGNEYTTPVGYWVKDGRLIVTTHSPWWHNLKGGQPVELLLKGQHRQGVATPYPDPKDVADYMETFIEHVVSMLLADSEYKYTVTANRPEQNSRQESKGRSSSRSN